MLKCEPGYYCQEGLKYPCPEGRYTDVAGTTDAQCLDTCGPGAGIEMSCKLVLYHAFSGYYCTGGSSTPYQHECGSPAVYCPRGSSYPHKVHNGFYCDITGADQGAQRYWNGVNLKVRTTYIASIL